MIVSYSLSRKRQALADAGHYPRLSRRSKGLTVTYPARTLYGTHLTCSCGWRCHSNEAPSKGGVQDVLGDWEQHASEATS